MDYANQFFSSREQCLTQRIPLSMFFRTTTTRMMMTIKSPSNMTNKDFFTSLRIQSAILLRILKSVTIRCQSFNNRWQFSPNRELITIKYGLRKVFKVQSLVNLFTSSNNQWSLNRRCALNSPMMFQKKYIYWNLL